MTTKTRALVLTAVVALLVIAGDVFARGGGGGGRGGGGGMRGGGGRSSGGSRPSSSSGGSIRQSSPGRSSGYSNTSKPRPSTPTTKPSKPATKPATKPSTGAGQRPAGGDSIAPRPSQPAAGTGAGGRDATKPSQGDANRPTQRDGTGERTAGDRQDQRDQAREDRQEAAKEARNDRQKAAKNRQEDRQDWAEDMHDDYWHGGWSVSIGVGISTLPAGAAAVTVGGGSYYCHGGFWYGARPGGGYVAVLPPHGCHLPALPVGYYTLWLHNRCYYYYGGVYYEYDTDEEDYEVVEAPVDAVVSALPGGAERVEIDGEVYYKLGDTLYKPIMVEGEVAYKVVKL